MPHLLSSDRRTETTPVRPPATGASDWATVCLNCAAPLAGPFCSHCGQRAVPPHPTTSELAGDAYAELVGWDGKFAETIRLLLRHPGELTRALLDGQRARYISPVRLYLLCSVFYFVVAAGAPPPNVEFDVGIGVGTGDADRTPEEAALARAVINGLGNLDPAERALAERADRRATPDRPADAARHGRGLSRADASGR